MIEIGKSKTIAIKQRDASGKLVAVAGPDGETATKTIANEIWRVTRNTLGGCYGSDKRKKLVVGLVNGDLLTLRPQGTRREVTVSLFDIYHWTLRTSALKVQLEKARLKKAAKQRQRESRRNRYAEKKLVEPIE